MSGRKLERRKSRRSRRDATPRRSSSIRSDSSVRLASKKILKLLKKRSSSTSSPAQTALFEDTVFATGITIRRVHQNSFSPSIPTLPDIASQMFFQYVIEDPNIYKLLTLEYLEYYTTCMLWIRIVSLKMKNNQKLTEQERKLYEITLNTKFCLPKPLHLVLSSLGNVRDETNETLIPEFPQLPCHVIKGHPGYYGEFVKVNGTRNDEAKSIISSNAQLHNLYCEIPCPGVSITAILHLLASEEPGPYQSVVTYNDKQPNVNLLAFHPISFFRNEAKNTALYNGILDDGFGEDVTGTGFNFSFLSSISNLLRRTRSFHNVTITIQSMSEQGARCQLGIQKPVDPESNLPCHRGFIMPTSATKEPEAEYGRGIFFCHQLYKESVSKVDHSSWAMFSSIPDYWIEARNSRRTISPMNYRSATQLGEIYRTNIINAFLLDLNSK